MPSHAPLEIAALGPCAIGHLGTHRRQHHAAQAAFRPPPPSPDSRCDAHDSPPRRLCPDRDGQRPPGATPEPSGHAARSPWHETRRNRRSARPAGCSAQSISTRALPAGAPCHSSHLRSAEQQHAHRVRSKPRCHHDTRSRKHTHNTQHQYQGMAASKQ